MADVVAEKIIVFGRVQGVFYRASTGHEARALGLSGWVRNRQDGSVEIWAEGEAEAVEKLKAWCRRGPPGAMVSGINVEKAAPGGYSDFVIKY